MNVSIYIKSSFRGNPRGAGEAAAVIEFIDKQGKSHKRQQRTQIEADTKNALHLKICIAAMRVLLKPCDIKIYIDCEYMANHCRRKPMFCFRQRETHYAQYIIKCQVLRRQIRHHSKQGHNTAIYRHCQRLALSVISVYISH